MILTLTALALFAPLCAYIALRVSGRRAWGVVQDGHVSQGAGVYRSVAVPTWKRGSPPFVVRAASFSSLLLGQMVVPGGLAALLGMLFLVDAEISRSGRGPLTLLLAVLVLSGPTGLVVAVKLLIAGQAMVRRASSAIASTRSAARWAIWHNLVLSAALAVVPILEPVFGSDQIAQIEVCYAYVAVSLAHALLLRRAARALEAYDAAQAADPAPADPAIPAPSA
ncbi:hypothetical protein WME89_20810 [Sorangium sp. So ce321]|uniref:hypothetical protein n=1 Tax=Sorangium sp. So ce321 TaxID=3133300 RepID=UPI003F5E2688